VRQKAAALFFEKSKSQSKKEHGETAAALNLKKRPHERKPTSRNAPMKKYIYLVFVAAFN
jgi:hypothetical protein